MSDIFVEIQNQSFTEVTIRKTSSQEPITTIGSGAKQTFKLLDTAHTVTICAIAKGDAIVSLEGVIDTQQIYVHSQETKELDDNDPLVLNLTQSTVLTLQWTSPDEDGVKCGEVIIQPPIV